MELLRLNEDQKRFLSGVRAAMEASFGDDRRRIAHALRVAGHAERLLTYIEADPVLTLTAAYLHDIGIHEAERRHGSPAGRWQEIEGPPIARRLLLELGAGDALVAAVCELVGRHHTPAGVDSPEFRILWDADALVNFDEVLAGKSPAQIGRILDRHMTTEPGYRLARQFYLAADPAGEGTLPRQDASGKELTA